MTIYDYIDKFRDNRYIYIGDGLISSHTDDKSLVFNGDGKVLMELSKEEYCINAKNSHYLIANWERKRFYIINNDRETIFQCEESSISILKYRDVYAFYCSESNSVQFINFAGKKVFEYTCKSFNSVYEIYQLTPDIVSLEVAADFECRDFDNNLRKNIIINISTNQIVKQGTFEYDNDKSIICNAMLFELPKTFKYKRYSWMSEESVTLKIPTIKYTVVEPDYDDNDKVVYHKHVEFCDFLGNIVLCTDYSEISGQVDGFYLVERQPLRNGNTVYGILDDTFQEFLPCLYPELTIRDKQILIEHPNWSDWEDSILDQSSKRFIAKNKKGRTILLPYTYSSCSEGIKDIESNLLEAHRYDQNGKYCKGIIDADGTELLPAVYSNIYALSKNLLEAFEYDEYRSSQLVFIEGNSIALLNKYLKVEVDQHGEYFRVRVLNNDISAGIKLGIVNSSGVEIVPPIYDFVFFPREEKVNYIKNQIPGWLDLQDGSIHEYPRYSVIRSFKNGIATFSPDPVIVKSLSKGTEQTGYDYDNDCECYGTYHYDDVCGELCIRFQYSYREGLIDNSGRIILEPIYTELKREYFLDNLIFVKKDYQWGIVNNSGEFIVPTQYDWYDTNTENFEYEFEDAAFCCGTETKVDYYNKDAELIYSEDKKQFERRGYQNQDYEDNHNYDRDTFYALGGDDYDSFRENGGNIDDMMDSMGF